MARDLAPTLTRNKQLVANAEKAGGLGAYHKTLITECERLRSIIGSTAPALPVTARSGVYEVMTLEDIKGNLEVAARAKAVVKPTAPVSAESIGRTVVSLASDGRPEVSAPILAGLNSSLAARLGLSVEQTITREEFASLSHAHRSEYCRNGGRIRSDEPAPVPPLAPGAKIATRAQFDLIPHAERGLFIRNGGKLKD